MSELISSIYPFGCLLKARTLAYDNGCENSVMQMTGQSERTKRWWWGLGLGLMQLAIALSPPLIRLSHAAERITFSLGATIERSISVDSLEIFIKEGRVTEELAPYLSFIEGMEGMDPEMLEQIRGLLSQRADLDVTAVAQFAYTPQGEYLLEQAGEVFRTGARLPGGKGIRGAAIVAAADQAEGLTFINVIRRFPTSVLRIDLRKGLAIAAQASAAVNQSSQALSLIEQISFQAATEPFPVGTSAAEINQLVSRPGPFQVRRLSTRVKASAEPVDIYLPESPAFSDKSQSLPGVAKQAGTRRPAVVISHGLGSDRSTYAYLAQFLAAHGFAVINVEHPGSSASQLNALISGRTNQVVPDEEFINRPLLISQVLDGLANQAPFDKNLASIDFNNVGVIGQSFGGYTAFAVAGAPLNLTSLRSACPPEFGINISLLLQCQAAEIASPNQANLSFKDPRIKAIVAINPITSAVFGPESLGQVDIPVLMIAGSADTVAPALPEQIRPFTWLTKRDRYLLVMEGATHFSTIGITGNETFDLPSEIIGPSPAIAQRYSQVMSMAFMSAYLRGDSRYRPVLSSAFTTRFSRPEMPLSLIARLTPEQLETRLRASAVDPQLDSQLDQVLQQAIDAAVADETARLNLPTDPQTDRPTADVPIISSP